LLTILGIISSPTISETPTTREPNNSMKVNNNKSSETNTATLTKTVSTTSIEAIRNSLTIEKPKKTTNKTPKFEFEDVEVALQKLYDLFPLLEKDVVESILIAQYVSFSLIFSIPLIKEMKVFLKDALSCFMNSLNYNGNIIENRVNSRNMRASLMFITFFSFSRI
jgi:hypothetical protein